MYKTQNPFIVGHVIEVDGLKVVIRMKSNSNNLTYYYDGKHYRGVNIGEYVGIIRGPYTIVGKVTREFLKDSMGSIESQEYTLNRFVRNVELSIIGCFINDSFYLGMKSFPMIYNEVVLLEDDQISRIMFGNKKAQNSILVGETVQERLPVNLDWSTLFNTHIGIFGNTGSGKSNTLAKLYTELFDTISIEKVTASSFLVIDFNGEYISDGILSNHKNVYWLNTSSKTEGDKYPISSKIFWNTEVLSILFSATEQTQKPFLSSAINFYLDNGTKEKLSIEDLINFITMGFRNVFIANSNKEALNLLKHVYRKIKLEPKNIPWYDLQWHSQNSTYYTGKFFIGSCTEEDINQKSEELRKILEDNASLIGNLSEIDQLSIIVNLRLIYGLRYNHNQFDFINPLLNRIESRSKNLNKIISITNNEAKTSGISIISLRNCNQEVKKILPLLVAKQLYDSHKDIVEHSPNHTFHLIIDEAHNILSEKSSREAENWKDYRLEVFEEIIKEGRKFGFFLTLASQRPSDISPTIVSQVHNYFIHRLVNEFDLRLIDNTLNTLDNVSKKMIPALAPGQCIITGTSFPLPLVVQVERLMEGKTPKSDNINLFDIWKK